MGSTKMYKSFMSKLKKKFHVLICIKKLKKKNLKNIILKIYMVDILMLREIKLSQRFCLTI